MDEPSLVRADRGGERRPERQNGLRAAGANLPRIVGPILARHGGSILARLKSEWIAIVGPELGAVIWPEALARGGVLKLRVAPGRGLEVQHRTPLVIERINLFFGREAVTRLSLVQGPLPLRAPAPPQPARPIGAREAAALDQQLAGIASPELRDALARLGRRIIGAAD
jgi:hypothetical protein